MKVRPYVCVLLTFISLMQTGCMIPFGLQPPPEAYEQWKKPGAYVHPQQVMASLLECGFPWPWQRVGDLQRVWGSSWESSAVLADRCMESQGYVRDYGSKAQCDEGLAEPSRKYRTKEQIEALERACDPKTPIPLPSVERRLNGPYCRTKEYRQYPQCQPVVPPISSSESNALFPAVVPKYPAVDRVTPQIQTDSNTQMNQLLLDTQSGK